LHGLGGNKYRHRGKKYHIFPQLKYTDTVTKKDCVQQEKYDLISLLLYFLPSTPSIKVKQLLHGLSGKKIKTQGKKYHIISPNWIFVLFSVTVKIVGEKI
jgi:hypothetical protein